MNERPMVLRPMLAKSVATSRLMRMCADDRYWADQKIDGHRLLIHVGGGLFHPSSRTGITYNVSAAVRNCFAPLVESDVLWIFDGEYLSNTFWIFDLPEVGGRVSCDDPFEERRNTLDNFFPQWQPAECVQLVPIAKTTEEKEELALRALQANAEGVMFKLRAGKYSEGKRSDAILKCKYRFDADCVVTELGRGRNADGDIKQNMVLAMVDGNGHLVEVAECTTLAGDGPKVQVGDVVTVKCLYSTDDNRLYQPTFPKVRLDKKPEECVIAQLDDIRPDKTVIR